MTTFKKTFLIALIAQTAYWLIAALVFVHGQYILHDATAIVAGLYITRQVYKRGYIRVWFTPLAWIAFSLASYYLIMAHIRFTNWTLASFMPTDYWNHIRFFDIVLISLLTAYGVVLGKKWFHSKKHS